MLRLALWSCNRGLVLRIPSRALKVDGWKPPDAEHDQAVEDIKCVVARGGTGGAGCSSLSRPHPRKVVADGGFGGHGGNVILRADEGVTSLRSVKRSLKAAAGKPGSSQDTTGQCGKDLIVPVPVATSVKLLDKVFATPPQLKAQYAPHEHQQAEDGATLKGMRKQIARVAGAPRDAEEAKLFERFLALRQEQSARGERPHAVSLEQMEAYFPARNFRDKRRARRARMDAAAALGELLSHGDEMVVARGGGGGAGNASLPPRDWGAGAQWSLAGGSPEEVSLVLQMRMLADVALIGFPNAGKSSLLRAMTRSTPQVAPYAFTTLRPQLGAVLGRDTEDSVVVADLPGLVRGAHRDRGLGVDFLRHIQRSRCLVYVLDLGLLAHSTVGAAGELAQSGTLKLDSPTFAPVLLQLESLVAELRAYDARLMCKPSVIVLNKQDLAGRLATELRHKLCSYLASGALGLPSAPVLCTAACSGAGVSRLQELLRDAHAVSHD